MEDEMIEFLEKDKIKSFDDLSETMLQKKDIEFNNIDIESYLIGSEILIIQSSEFAEKSGIPRFMLKVKNNLSFEAYHIGIKCTINIKSLSKNRVTILDKLSKLQEAIRYLFYMEVDQKKSVLLQQVMSMSSMIQVGDKKYTPDVTVRAFEHFTISRSAYSLMRRDYELPSIDTLTRLTSKVKNLGDDLFLKNVFSNIVNDKQKSCYILIDEVYVKPMLQYHGGSIYGEACNNFGVLAKTVLGFMVVSLFGGPKFLYRMLPVQGLTTPKLLK